MPTPAPRNSAPLLEVEGLTVRFAGAPAAVVEDLSLSLAPGETLCIVGESGCGKSVTALALMGLLPRGLARVEAGAARLMGEDLLGMAPERLQDLRGDRMAMIFQEPMTSLNPAFTVGDQIGEAVRRHRGASRAQGRARALEMLRRVGIPAAEARLDAYPHEMSGGMRQRVMIAMALACDPAVLIADEPTTALDATVQAQILQLIRDLQAESGAGMILITHDLGVVAEVADRVAVMYAGRIVESGPADAVFADPQHPYTLGLMGSAPGFLGGAPGGRLATIPGLVPTAATMPPGCRFATRCPFAAPRCAQTPPLAEAAPGHRVACWFAPLEERLEGAA